MFKLEIGIDCVEIARFPEQKKDFFNKVFTKKEILHCENKVRPMQHYAARFAGKEAVIKAFHPFGITLDVGKIEILNDDKGRPKIHINHKSSNQYEIKISLSHSNTIAIATAVVIAKKEVN